MGQKQIHMKGVVLHLEAIERQLKKSQEKIAAQRKLIEKTLKSSLPRCANCGYNNMRVRMDKSYFCQSCGHDSRT